MKKIRLFENFDSVDKINEGVIYSYESLPVLTDTLQKIVYSNDYVDYYFSNGHNIGGFVSTNDRLLAAQANGVEDEYNKLHQEFISNSVKDSYVNGKAFYLNGKKALVLDIKLVLETGNDPNFMLWVAIEDTMKYTSDGSGYMSSKYEDYSVEDFRNAVDK